MRLRGKLLLVSLSLLVLPWAGWQLLRLMGEVLREGQELALVASAEAVARGLAQRPNALPAAGPGLFAQALARAPRLDGDVADWGDAAAALQRVGGIERGFDLLLGRVEDTFYLFIDVDDDSPARADAHWPIAARRDHVRLDLHGPQGVVGLRMANAASGQLVVTDVEGGPVPLRVTGHWREREGGYAVELALPQGYALRALAINVADADDQGGSHRHGTDVQTAGRPWRVLAHSEGLSSSLAQLLPAGMRGRVLDRQGWALAQAGQLAATGGGDPVPGWRRWLYHRLLFAHATDPASGHEQAGRSDAGEVATALAGEAATAWRRGGAGERLILSAAVPVTVAGQIRATVLLERESDALLRLTDRAFSGLFGLTLLALLAVVAVLFVFAGRLGARIRRLRDATENALDRDGRVRGFPVSGARDEIGDLSRSFARLLDEVGIYTGYLRGLAGKLSHEINTPIAIVRTSLENLEAEPHSPEARVYLDRARGGVERLGTLVRAMSEASRIEQAIGSAHDEVADLRRLVAECAEGYRPLLAPRTLHLDLPAAALPLRCVPDLIAQALDKLVDNALGFCPEDGWVRIALAPAPDGAVITVANSGPPLPAHMRDKLFDSLVSVRERRGAGVHLGFGLHVVKLVAGLHRGGVEAADLDDGGGVRFALTLCNMAGAAATPSAKP